MFDGMIRRMEGTPPRLVTAVGVVLVLAIGAADHVTGAQLSLSVFYLLPIGLVAWRVGRGWSYAFSVVSAAIWYLANLPGSLAMGFTPGILLWNMATRLGFFVIVSSLTWSLRRLLQRERERANTDPLTGLLNRRAFYEVGALELERARRYGRPLSMIYMDLDGFKALNDRLGHSAGDEALQAVSALLASQVRANDILARLGGDEFGLMLPESAARAALAAATKLQRRVREGLPGGAEVGLCMGVVTYLQAPETVDQLVGAADHLMYAAKRTGGSRVAHRVIGADL